jgi:predicted Rossmann fold nucleotide-binding protein DprA/Smf involved in DNA uptake
MVHANSYTIRTATIRTAMMASRYLDNQPRPFPYFLHKWTQLPKQYSVKDLYLPEVLYFKGKLPNWNSFGVGVCGTRSPSAEAFRLASMIATEVAKMDTIILSGGVPGIDLAAHMATIDVASGRTIAVLANTPNNGLRGHEWNNSIVEREMLKHGGFMSEYSSDCEIWGTEFKERLLDRDRIISGLCDLLLVFECNRNSATVDTVERAILQGKRVICIDATRKTSRRGIDQLVNEFKVPVLREEENSIESIVRRIRESMHSKV